jgi:acylphosphatase
MATGKRVRLKISGRVQGVCFRFETKRCADAMGVAGWVRNRSDGTVEALCEGDGTDVDALVAWCRGGPRLARVEAVRVEKEDYRQEFSGFEVTY